MKKIKSIIIAASILFSLFPLKAEAFLLPPFKVDLVNSLQKGYTTIKTKVDKAYKMVMESNIMQTIIQIGEGAREAYDFVKSVNFDSIQNILGADYRQISVLSSKIKKIDIQKTEAKDKAAQEAGAIAKEAAEKEKSINDNINKLSQDSLLNPDHAVANTAKISELIAKKDEIIANAQNETTGINDALNKALQGFNDMKDAARAELKAILSEFNPLPKNYNSVEDLKDTVKMLSPAQDTRVTSNIVYAYKERYNALYWEDLNTAMQRATAIRAQLVANNENAQTVNQAASSTLEGSTSANAAASLELKKANMLALLDYAELVLQRLKLDISYDLSVGGFQKINATTAVDNFNFDNYKFNPEDPEYDVDDVTLSPATQGTPLDSSITAASEPAVAAGLADISASATKE